MEILILARIQQEKILCPIPIHIHIGMYVCIWQQFGLQRGKYINFPKLKKKRRKFRKKKSLHLCECVYLRQISQSFFSQWLVGRSTIAGKRGQRPIVVVFPQIINKSLRCGSSTCVRMCICVCVCVFVWSALLYFLLNLMCRSSSYS